MMLKARRFLASTLILALLASALPPGAAALVARGPGAAARTSVPSGLPGGGAAFAAPAAVSLTAPALGPAAASISPAPLFPLDLAALAAPSDAPEPGAAPKDAAAEPGETAPPSAADAPKAAASEGRRSLLGGLKALLSRAARKAAMAPDLDKGGADRFFDAAAPKPEGPAVPLFSARGAAGRWALKRFEKHAERRARDSDDFGGPKPLGPKTGAQKAGYGLKWGLNMVGIVALYDLLLAPLFAAVPWPALLSDGALEAFGRVALLTQVGPAGIGEALSMAPATFLGLPVLAAAAALLAAKPLAGKLSGARYGRLAKPLVYGAAALAAAYALLSAPGAFLGMSLPVMVGMEEVSYRVLAFLPSFAILALTRPVMNWLAVQMDKIPNHAGARGGVQKVMRFIGGTFAWYAYPFAAVMASISFATAHFANWGADPYVFAVQFTLGMVLTRLAYRSESLTAPFAAHLSFNLLTLSVPLLDALGMPGFATTYGVLLSVLGAVFLLYNYLSYRKERAAAGKGPGAGKALAVAALAAGLAFGAAQLAVKSPEAASWTHGAPAATLARHAAKAHSAPRAGAPKPAAAAAKESRVDMIARVSPSVFRVRTNQGSGTGFIISRQGMAVTNAHVTGATPVGGFVIVDLPGAPPLMASLLAVNHDKDIALLQLPPHPSGAWEALAIAQDAPRVGEETVAVGYPMGLEQTVTRGIVSGVGRHMNLYVAHIQTDASINPGNSGGPLFNEKGEIIGINTMIVTRSGGSMGLGFSITAPDLSRAVEQYAARGDIASGRLGVIIDLSAPLKPEAGLEVEHVRPGSGAAQAGLRRGDLIIAIGETELDMQAEQAAESMAAALAKTMPGQKVPVTVLRGDQQLTLEVVIDAKDSKSGR